MFRPTPPICYLPGVPPTGVEPAHPPPEGGALSTELRGHDLGLKLYIRYSGIDAEFALFTTELLSKPHKGISERIRARKITWAELGELGESAYERCRCRY